MAGPVHHFHAARNDAGRDDVGHALPGILAGRKADQHGARRLGLLQDAHGHFGDDAEQALRAGHQAQQVIALAVEMLAAEPDHLAGDQHHLDAQHVVGGEPVFEAVHAAGILRHIAADGAGDLRGGVGRVVEALVLHRLGDGEVGDARLHHGAAVGVSRCPGSRLNLAMPSRMPSASGRAPPDSEVPAPRGTTLIAFSWA